MISKYSFLAFKNSDENNQVTFYELMTISEYQGSLLLQLKHFAQDLIGREEKPQSMDFKWVRLTDNAVYFEAHPYKGMSQNEMHI